MNKPPTHNNNTDERGNDSPYLHFGEHRVHRRAAALFLGLLTAFLLAGSSYLGVLYQVKPDLVEVPSVELQEPVLVVPGEGETHDLVERLKRQGLWRFPGDGRVPPFLIESFPADLNLVSDIDVRKKVFLHSLLPHALLVRQETLQKRRKLERLLSRIDCNVDGLDFRRGLDFEDQCSWTSFLDEEEEGFILDLCRDYRTTSVQELLERVDAIPVSIILAQGALESSWGASRFTREGNSIFGMWTWKTKGMVPSRREEGLTHKVKVYENVLESVRAYHLTLNRLDSYEELRQLRLESDDPLVMAEGLKLYSARGEDYVRDIKKVILSNELQKYDTCTLSASDISERKFSPSSSFRLADQNRASM